MICQMSMCMMKSLVTESRKYFENGNQTTVLAFDNEIVVGCASLSYIWIMPTFDHPTGTRAHFDECIYKIKL